MTGFGGIAQQGVNNLVGGLAAAPMPEPPMPTDSEFWYVLAVGSDRQRTTWYASRELANSAAEQIALRTASRVFVMRAESCYERQTPPVTRFDLSSPSARAALPHARIG